MKVCAENEYFETLKPVLNILKMYGILPFVLNNKDTCRRTCITLLVNLLSMIIYSITSGSSILFIGNSVVSLMKHFNFAHFVRITTEITLRIYVLIVPFAMWNKSELFTQYYDQWKYLQNDLELMSGVSYKCPAKKGIQWMAYFLLQFSTITMAISYYFLGKSILISHRLSMVLVFSMSNLTFAYWYSNCIFTRDVIQVIHKHIQETVKEESKNSEKLQKLVTMWIQICDLIDRFNSMHSILFLAQTVLGVTNGISNFYSVVLSYILRTKENLVPGYAIGFVIGVSITYMYCESANSLYKQLVYNVQETLLRKNMSEISTTCLQTMSFFLNTIEVRNPKIQLNGVVVIDRSTFLAMLGAGMNYLIILAQFGTLAGT